MALIALGLEDNQANILLFAKQRLLNFKQLSLPLNHHSIKNLNSKGVLSCLPETDIFFQRCQVDPSLSTLQQRYVIELEIEQRLSRCAEQLFYDFFSLEDDQYQWFACERDKCQQLNQASAALNQPLIVLDVDRYCLLRTYEFMLSRCSSFEDLCWLHRGTQSCFLFYFQQSTLIKQHVLLNSLIDNLSAEEFIALVQSHCDKFSGRYVFTGHWCDDMQQKIQQHVETMTFNPFHHLKGIESQACRVLRESGEKYVELFGLVIRDLKDACR